MYIEHSACNAAQILQLFAHCFGARTNGDHFEVPPVYGEGQLNAYNFSSGISALVSELRLNERLLIKRNRHSTAQDFVLQFNEIAETPATNDAGIVSAQPADTRRSVVRLSSSLKAAETEFLPSYRVRAITIIFNKQALLNFLDFDAIEKFIGTFFSLYLKKNFVAAIDAECRLIMLDLFRDIYSHPLQNLFVENRVLLLLEKFMHNFIVKEQHTAKKLQFKEDEISRLVKAENTLLEDFGKLPPTISQLSKLCAMSSTKFKNDFKILYGLPVYEYYQKNRMAHARALIQGGDYSIKEVGMMIGYSNLGHFAAAFKREYNMLPSEWLHANKLHPLVNESGYPFTGS